MIKMKSILSVLLLVAVLVLNGCNRAAEEAASLGADVITEAPLVGSFYVVGYKGTTFTPYATHKLVGGINVDSDWTQSCSVPASDLNTSAADIVCLIEAHELDLYARGVTLKMSVPPGLCDYALETPYYYFKLLPGVGSPGPFAYSSTDPVCAFDYSVTGGPNCCEGSWTMSAGTVDQAARNGQYSGSFTNCLSGPNLSEFDKDPLNRPVSKLYSESDDGLAISRFVEAPVSKILSSNIRAANYFRPSDHTNISNYLPAADLFGGTTAPIAFNTFTNAGGSKIKAHPFHTYICYNTDSEVKARIRVMVREWNLLSELHQGGDPDTGGTSGSDPLNDLFDWKDFATPNTLFPGAAE